MAFSDLLAIPEVCFIIIYLPNELLGLNWQLALLHDTLGLSYKNSDELNKIINDKLPGRPQFKCHEIVQSGEAFEFYSHDILKCLEALWEDMTVQMYHDMHTGKWWWTTQV